MCKARKLLCIILTLRKVSNLLMSPQSCERYETKQKPFSYVNRFIKLLGFTPVEIKRDNNTSTM